MIFVRKRSTEFRISSNLQERLNFFLKRGVSPVPRTIRTIRLGLGCGKDGEILIGDTEKAELGRPSHKGKLYSATACNKECSSGDAA